MITKLGLKIHNKLAEKINNMTLEEKKAYLESIMNNPKTKTMKTYTEEQIKDIMKEMMHEFENFCYYPKGVIEEKIILALRKEGIDITRIPDLDED